MDTVWPILDFSKFPNEMISGLTLEEINKIVEEDTILDEIADKLDDLLESPAAEQSERFGPELTDFDVHTLNSQTVSKNTLKRDRWAALILQNWLDIRNAKSLLELDDGELITLLPRFIHEIRRKDGKRYPGSTLVSIVAGIQKTISNQRNINFFRDEKFKIIRDSLDASMKISTKEGGNLMKKSAGVISYEQEEKLWKHSLGDDTPQKLINTLFYLNGIHFALRGGEEHCSLTMDQFHTEYRDGKKCLIYTEKSSKTYVGGLKNIRNTPKQVVHYANDDNKQRCHVALFEKFVQVRPYNVNRFYLLPVKLPKANSCWFTERPIGKNSLAKFMKIICANASIPQFVTNHSLRATSALLASIRQTLTNKP